MIMIETHKGELECDKCYVPPPICYECRNGLVHNELIPMHLNYKAVQGICDYCKHIYQDLMW